jgi:SAM-dependent methyltransferase
VNHGGFRASLNCAKGASCCHPADGLAPHQLDGMEIRTKIYQSQGNRALLNLLPQIKGRVLDCGCGTGANGAILKSWGWQTVGLTISPGELEIAKESYDSIFLADLEQGLPDDVGQNYDVVLMSHVLEHLIHPENLLQDAKGVLTTGGLLAVALPNFLTYSNRIKMLFGKLAYESSGIMDENHVRIYSFKTGKKLLEDNGYIVFLAKAQGFFPLWKLRQFFPELLNDALNSLVSKWIPGFFGFQFLYLAKLPI